MSISMAMEGVSDAIMRGEQVEKNVNKYVAAGPVDESAAGNNSRKRTNSLLSGTRNTSMHDVINETSFHPYIKVSCNEGPTKKTRHVLHSTTNPAWFETLSFKLGAEKKTQENKSTRTLRKHSSKPEHPTETWLTFEAVHRDLSVTSLDDYIGDGILAVDTLRLTGEKEWSAKEQIRLHNHRGVSTGILFVLLQWKRTELNLVSKEPPTSMTTTSQHTSSKNTSDVEMAASPAPLASPASPTSSASIQSSDLRRISTSHVPVIVHPFPNGVLSVVVERADHLTDPNTVATLAITRSTRMLLMSSMIVLGYFALGAVVYLSFEGPDSGIDTTVVDPGVSNATGKIMFRNVIDVMYFSVCTFTTVGYGDVVPQNVAMKLFTVLYSLYGVAIVAVGVNVMVNSCLDSAKAWIHIAGEHCCGHKTMAHKLLVQKPVTSKKVRAQLCALLLKLFATILVGTIVFMLPGMIEDNKPGLSFVNALYLATMTASSIGFGDLSPKNNTGRLFFVFWMIGGYVIVASSIREISQLYLKLKEREAEMRILNRKVGSDVLGLDADGDGEVDKFEYLSHMIVVLGKMQRHEVMEIMTRFKELDVTGDGKISSADFENLAKSSI